jgi:hypothetical protein
MSPRFRRLLCWPIAGLCVLYMLNIGAGFIELIPDNFPVIGNLDEAGAMVLLFRCIREIRSKGPP